LQTHKTIANFSKKGNKIKDDVEHKEIRINKLQELDIKKINDENDKKSIPFFLKEILIKNLFLIRS